MHKYFIDYLNRTGRRSHQDGLENPEADVGQRSEGVVADVLTARLGRVADKLALLIVVDRLASHGCQDDAEDEEDGEPDLAHKRGVIVNFLQQARQEAPAHGNGRKTTARASIRLPLATCGREEKPA
uniref:Uncharacterized protein n=1 Tax=Poecilia reticulata TaxID=8081 RepID=A0A3P9QFU1_POERE